MGTTRIPLMLLAASTLYGCAPEKPQKVSLEEASPEIKRQSVSLVKAVEDKLVVASLANARSSNSDLALNLRPLVSSQPWVRIDPGWRVSGFGKNSYVTSQTVFVRLPAKGNYTVFLTYMQLHKVKSIGVPNNAKLGRVEDRRIQRLLSTAEASVPRPSRRVLQFGLWAVADDLGYEEVRPPANGSGSKSGFILPRELYEVAQLLERSGFDKLDFRLMRDALSELEGLIDRYEQLSDAQDAKALVPFKKICAFYPFELAQESVVAAFDQHSGTRGRAIRGHAIKTLARVGGVREVEVLKEKISYEDDDSLISEINKVLQAAAKPAK